MSEAKIELTVGAVSFAGSGEPEWLASQLATVIEAAPRLAAVAPTPALSGGGNGSGAAPAGQPTGTLASYLKSTSAEGNQVRRFLATADWLRLKGANPLTTAAVSKALKDNQQGRLANPADCLLKNISKGFCEKTDGGFYITPEGLASLGHK